MLSIHRRASRRKALATAGLAGLLALGALSFACADADRDREAIAVRTETVAPRRIDDRTTLAAQIGRGASGGLVASAAARSRDVAYLALGDSVRVLPLAGGRIATARIVEVATAAEPGGFTLRAELDEEAPFEPGDEVLLELSRRVLDRALLVPVAALVEHGSGFAVFVVEREAAHLRPVVTGAVVGQRIEIVGGLEAGEQVVTAGRPADGQRIRRVAGQQKF